MILGPTVTGELPKALLKVSVGTGLAVLSATRPSERQAAG